MIEQSNKEWIVTHSGRRYFHAHPDPDSIVIEDLAHSLSHLCRFAGHVNTFYSVAEHCVRVSYVCPPEHQLWGLLHDGSECYCVDIPRPLKRAAGMEGYRVYEKLSQDTICHVFGLGTEEPDDVKAADVRLLYTEKRDLLIPSGPKWTSEKNVTGLNSTPLPSVIDPWTSAQAKNRFLMRYYELSGVREFH